MPSWVNGLHKNQQTMAEKKIIGFGGAQKTWLVDCLKEYKNIQ
jgi:hypothetical protein